MHGMRSLCSATLDLAYIAMRSFDLWCEGGCWEWDVAAVICLVDEAGGMIATANPPRDWQMCTLEKVKHGGRQYIAIRLAFDALNAQRLADRTKNELWGRSGEELKRWAVLDLIHEKAETAMITRIEASVVEL